jgi:hypothetical protein
VTLNEIECLYADTREEISYYSDDEDAVHLTLRAFAMLFLAEYLTHAEITDPIKAETVIDDLKYGVLGFLKKDGLQ